MVLLDNDTKKINISIPDDTLPYKILVKEVIIKSHYSIKL